VSNNFANFRSQYSQADVSLFNRVKDHEIIKKNAV